jgi:non-specific serine/threonine protein kinase
MGLTQAELAVRAGLSTRGVSDLERGLRGAPYPDTVARLANALVLGEAERTRLHIAARYGRGPLDPRLAAPPASESPLPEQLTSFVGREREIARVQHLLGTTRLLTLSGTGGVGKTRLALEVARVCVHAYRDGVTLVDLAALASGDLVPRAVATALGLVEQSTVPAHAVLVETLRPQQRLLVLDNCEHLASACADLAETLLRACARLRILATSREALAVPGELVWRVPSLGLPPPVSEAGLSEIARAESVRLFVDRAQTASDGFTLNADNALDVSEICSRLDGIPLAIELAAARVRLMAPRQIGERLEHALQVLAPGSRSAPARQQTLRATLEWSYRLLDEPERLLFAYLSVFAAGWTLEAAESICATSGVATEDVLELLSRLVDRSLVQVEPRPGGMVRYRLLETLRQFAEERLRDGGDLDVLRARHADYFVDLGRQAEPHMNGGPHFATWVERLESERDNVRAALRWCVARGEVERGLALGAAVWRMWYVRGALSEGREWLEALLRLSRGSGRTATQAKVLSAAAALIAQQGDHARAEALLGEALEIARELGDTRRICICFNNLGISLRSRGQLALASARLMEAIASAQACGERIMEAISLANLADVLIEQSDLPAASRLLERCLAGWRDLSDAAGTASATGRIGYVALAMGDLATAATLCERAVHLHRAVGNAVGMMCRLIELAWVRHVQGDDDAARALFEEGLVLSQGLGSRPMLARFFEGLAAIDAADHPERSLRLAGAAAGVREAIGSATQDVPGSSTLSLIDKQQLAWLEPTRRAFGEPAARRAWSEGAALALGEAVAYALAPRVIASS